MLEHILFHMILYLYLLYLNYILFNMIDILSQKLLKYDKLFIESDMKINRIGIKLYDIHKKTIELTDIKLEGLEEEIFNKLKIY